MLWEVRKWTDRPNVKKGIIKGTRRSPALEHPHTVISGNNTDHRLNLLMDDLYEVYRLDPGTDNGICIMPWIGTLRYHAESEFHIYSTKEGVVKGFYAMFVNESSNILLPVPTMTFVWVVPRFRRKGLFRQMYDDLVDKRGPILVDHPNEVCKACLEAMGYSQNQVIDFYSQPTP